MTKAVSFFIDLPPAWQDFEAPLCLPMGEKSVGYYSIPPGYKRVRFDVELPCFGGSAEAELTAKTTIKSVEQQTE